MPRDLPLFALQRLPSGMGYAAWLSRACRSRCGTAVVRQFVRRNGFFCSALYIAGMEHEILTLAAIYATILFTAGLFIYGFLRHG
jgi:hypothetical protein